MIEVLSNGALNTIQDCGRFGWLSSGISHGGAMDRPALQTANSLVGNDVCAAGIEVQLFPFRMRALTDLDVAVTGADCAATVDDVLMPPWWALPMRAGQTLTLRVPRHGARAYVAVSGGIDVPVRLGSRSTDVRGGFGGHEGRALVKGDRLVLGGGSATTLPNAGWGAVPPERCRNVGLAPIRVIPAAEDRCFDDDSRSALLSAPWKVTKEANRMGYRLSGPTLTLERPLELLSHGILPGTIQVPPSGQPIIQLADANTCGGYPKIAAVIDSDLWKLAQASTDADLRFSVAEQDEAVGALKAQAHWIAELAAARGSLGWVGNRA